MRINRLGRMLGLMAILLLAGCALPSEQRPVISLDTEARLMLERVYEVQALTHSLQVYGLSRQAIEAEVLNTCSIAYSIIARTENRPKERARQLKELHGSPYYIAEENRCVETLIANKINIKQWQRITDGDFQAGELIHLARFDVALAQFNDWAEQACPAKHLYIAGVFQALEQRIVRQQADIQLLQQHYREPKRLARVLSWHSGRRLEDYNSSLERARQFAQACRADRLPQYKGLTL